jgi:hypothetical protein
MIDVDALFPPPARPTPAEADALARAAAYLGRAGTAVASHLLGADAAAGDAALAAALRDQLLAGAALCHGLLDAGDGWAPAVRPRSRS